MRLKFSSADRLEFETALGHEWLETNGLGGYASSTIFDCHTRKYHGLLVVSLPPGDTKYLLLSKLEDTLVVGKEEFPLAVNKYPGSVFHPAGYHYIESFQHEVHPSTIFKCGDMRIRRSVLMPRGENAVLVAYELMEASRPVVLRVRPLLAYRNNHSLTSENLGLRVKTFPETDGFKIEPYPGLPPLHITANQQVKFFPGPYWNKNVEYQQEQARGYYYQEDLFCPGTFERKLSPGQPLIFRAAITPPEKDNRHDELWSKELARRQAERGHFAKDSKSVQALKSEAGAFLIRNGRGNPRYFPGIIGAPNQDATP